MAEGNNSFFNSLGGQSLIGAGSGLLGSIVGGLFAGRQQRKQYEYNSKLQRQQNDYALGQMAQQYEYDKAAYEQQRDDERQYNDPAAVRERLVSAGYSPMAAFEGAAGGGGVTASMDSGSMPSGPSGGGVSAPTADFSSLSRIPETISALRTQQSQREVNAALAENYRADARRKNLDSDNIDVILDSMRSSTESNQAKAALDRLEAVYRPILAAAQVGALDSKAQSDLASAFSTYRAGLKTQQEIDNFDLYKKSLEAQIAKAYADARQSNAAAETDDATREFKVGMLKVGIEEAAAEIGLKQADTERIQQVVEYYPKIFLRDTILQSSSEIRQWLDLAEEYRHNKNMEKILAKGKNGIFKGISEKVAASVISRLAFALMRK